MLCTTELGLPCHTDSGLLLLSGVAITAMTYYVLRHPTGNHYLKCIKRSRPYLQLQRHWHCLHCPARQPVEITALLMLCMCHLRKEISQPVQKHLLWLYNTELKLEHVNAHQLYEDYTQYLHRNPHHFGAGLMTLHARIRLFSTDQATSTLALLKHLATLDGEPTQEQTLFFRHVYKTLSDSLSSQVA